MTDDNDETVQPRALWRDLHEGRWTLRADVFVLRQRWGADKTSAFIAFLAWAHRVSRLLELQTRYARAPEPDHFEVLLMTSIGQLSEGRQFLGDVPSAPPAKNPSEQPFPGLLQTHFAAELADPMIRPLLQVAQSYLTKYRRDCPPSQQSISITPQDRGQDSEPNPLRYVRNKVIGHPRELDPTSKFVEHWSTTRPARQFEMLQTGSGVFLTSSFGPSALYLSGLLDFGATATATERATIMDALGAYAVAAAEAVNEFVTAFCAWLGDEGNV